MNLLPMEKCSILWTIRVGALPVLYQAANVEWLQFSQKKLLLVGLVAAKRTPTLLDRELCNVNNIACGVCRVLRTIAGVVPNTGVVALYSCHSC